MRKWTGIYCASDAVYMSKPFPGSEGKPSILGHSNLTVFEYCVARRNKACRVQKELEDRWT